MNARDRIGSGPWHNYNGVMIAQNVDDLHSDNNNLTKETQLNEKGQITNGRGDDPNMHDILVHIIHHHLSQFVLLFSLF